MVSREVRERTIKNLLALRRSKEETYKRALTLVNEKEQGVKAALSSNDPIEKSAGIFLVVGFCAASSEMASGEESGKTKFYAEGLISAVSTGDKDSMKLASRALFYLIQTSKSYAVEIADMTIRKCDEFIEKATTELQRTCVLILLHDFALFTPQYFLRKADHYFEYIFKTMKEYRNCRQYATDALHAALVVISQRENRSKNIWLDKCLHLAKDIRKDDTALAALHTLNELLRVGLARAECIRLNISVENYSVTSKTKSDVTANPVQWLMEDMRPPIVESQTAQSLILEKFSEILEIVRIAKNSRNTRSQPILLEIYPRLVAYDALFEQTNTPSTSTFNINETIQLLITGGAKYTPMLQCIGFICLHQPEATVDRVDAIMDLIVKHINSMKPMKYGVRETDIPVFRALSLMIRAHPNRTKHRVKDLLNQLFVIGFVKNTIIDVFHDIVMLQPDLRTDVHDGLLDLLYMVLMNQKRPNKLAPPQPPPEPRNGIMTIKPEDVATICLGLEVLGGFDFQRHDLRMFNRYLAQGYLHCDQVEVRLAAVECCARVVKPFVHAYNLVEQKEQPNVFALIRNILGGLINLAVVDREVEVRLRVLRSFASEDDKALKLHLAQQDVLQTLFMTVYDENPRIQEATVRLVGGLAEINPAHVYAKLQMLVHETIGQLANSKISHLEEQSAKCIAVLAERSPDIVMPYMDSILQALKPHLCYERRTVGVTVHVLKALSHLAGLGGVDVVNHLNDLFKPLLQHLQDSSSLSRREASLRALGGLCQSTAFVVDVYRVYPDLLEILLKLLKTELNVNMRRLIMKTLGITGAIDPYTYKVYIGTVFSTSSKSLAVSLPTEKESDDPRHDIILWINYEKCTLEQFYPAITIATLLQMMHDDSLTLLHKNIVFALVQILRDLKATLNDDAYEYVKFVHQVLPKFISLAKASTHEFRKFYMQQFIQLAPMFGVHMKLYMDDILALISTTWESHQELNGTVIDLLACIGNALGCEFSPHVVNLCPYLLAVVQMDMSRDKTLTKQALYCVSAINPCLDPHLNLILPPIIYVIDNTENTMPEDVRRIALQTLYAILSEHFVGERAPMIMQMWLRNIHNQPFHKLLMDTLEIICKQMWSLFVVYCDTVRAQLQRHHVLDTYIVGYYLVLESIDPTKAAEIRPFIEAQKDAINNAHYSRPRHVSRGNQLDNSSARSYQTVTEIMQRRRVEMSKSSSNSKEKPRMNEIGIHVLVHAFNPPADTSPREDWIQWIDNVRLECMLHSPAKSLNFCYNLAQDYPPLSKELFHATFMSIWTHLRTENQAALAKVLNKVLTTCPYSEPIQAILNLAEFMDHSEKGPLTDEYNVLSQSAAKVQAYAKALRYKELDLWERGANGIDFDLNSACATLDDCQQIISYAKKLNLEELALGMFKFVQSNDISPEGTNRWFEKLGRWNDALNCYKKEKPTTPMQILDCGLRQLRCHEQLYEWTELNELGTQLIAKFPEFGTERESTELKDRTLQVAARGAWAVGDYKRMSELTKRVNGNTVEGSFLRAVVSVHEANYSAAQGYINKVREIYDSEITAMAAESYERAYGAMMMSQHLTELEECIEYQLQPARRTRITVLWSRRLQGIAQDPDHWHKSLIVHQLVLKQSQLRPMWIKFAGLCRKRGRPQIAKRVIAKLSNLRETDDVFLLPVDTSYPMLALAFCKLLWHNTERDYKRKAVESLEKLAHDLHDRYQKNIRSAEVDRSMARVMSKCYLKLADWTKSLAKAEHLATTNVNQSSTSRRPSVSNRVHTPPVAVIDRPRRDEPTESVLDFYKRAAELNPKWHKAWQRLAILYYNLVMNDVTVVPEEEHEPELVGPGSLNNDLFSAMDDFNINDHLPPLGAGSSDEDELDGLPAEKYGGLETQILDSPSLNPHYQSLNTNTDTELAMRLPMNEPMKAYSMQNYEYANNAVHCHFEALVHSEGSRMEDTLRLLMLWIQYGEHQGVLNTIKSYLGRVPLEIWLEVAPQLIARLDLTNQVGHLVKLLMVDVAKAHPHGLVYPLIAATKAKNVVRNEAAKYILAAVRETNPTIVDQSMMLNEELIRCAILWHEMWHESLEDASRMYFQAGDYNVDQMMSVLKPLYDKLNAKEKTLKEHSFIQTYSKELYQALKHCRDFSATHSKQDITQAWDIFYNVFKKISHQLRSLNAMDLKYVAPKLAEARNLDICVPGTYDPAGPQIRIASIDTELTVIPSKQRPRKLTMRGSDDKDYVFLLKGHEDPRQDERVMQLFGLINLLVLRNQDTCRRDLTIQRYTIIPLSQSSGLIGWVPNCDTLHSLIKDYREKWKIPISAEHTCMQKICSDYEKLTLMQKVEVFRQSMRVTRGDDLRKTLWMKSPTSEVWFDRRTNYTRSMACMSMVGYILGLGDRHPSNVMLDRLSGKIVHIDFGDCFEVAMNRAKYPELVPFRLTRMLIRAMEVTGLEGNYRTTCERILRLIRDHKYSILAVLEAFVYDPVLWFRPADTPKEERTKLDLHIDKQMVEKAKEAIDRVNQKLNGTGFTPMPNDELSVEDQVNRLIDQATLAENLCQCYIGWCPFW